jgi:PAS domain S-box-containing protein
MSQEQENLASKDQSQTEEEVETLPHKLRASVAIWKEAFEWIEDAIIICDRQLKVIFVNSTWCEIMGYAPEEAYGKNIIDDLVIPEERLEAYMLLDQILQGGTVPPYLRSIKSSQGKVKVLRVVCVPIYNGVHYVSGSIAILHDITVEKEIEHIKDELLSTAAHELRTPMTAIQGITQSLLLSIERGSVLSPEALLKRLRVIQNATDKLILLTNNLGDLVKLQAIGYIRLPREQCDVNDLVARIVARQKNQHEASIIWDIALSSMPLLVFVNVGRIERAVSNILENAFKYSPLGGTITVQTKQDGKYATIVIVDQGIGIPKEEVTKITEAFYRASNATSHNYAGIGLGLFFAKTIINAHDGVIDFNSENGCGTTVTIQIPLIG